jgi:LysR family transcriptional activator of nhaA
VRVVGRLPEVRERFYAISAERKIKNPIVSAVTSAARRQVFEGGSRD